MGKLSICLGKKTLLRVSNFCTVFVEIALYRKLSFIIGDNEPDHEKSVEITETCESDPEESKKTEKAVDPQIGQFQAEAENNTSQTAFHVLGGFKEKAVQKVALINNIYKF